MGMGKPRALEASWQAMLAELRWRAERACNLLSELFSWEARYFSEKAELVIRELDLPQAKASMLLDFAEKAVECLDKAHPQAESKLQKLLAALEKNSVKVEPSPYGKKTLHVTPMNEGWHVNASRTHEWMFSLPIHGVSKDTSFPDILRLNSEELYYLQAGWRASDEGEDKGAPEMATTQAWQVIAWAAVRHGSLWIYLKALNLNKGRLSIKWCIKAKSWEQQWPTREGKKLAQQAAKQHPLALLTWYLGDGERHKYDLRYAVGNSEEHLPKELAQQIVQAAYQTSYGKLLDLLGSEKWEALKQLLPKQHPVYAAFQGYTFWLTYHAYHEGRRILQAFSLFKDPSEAEKLAKALADIGIEARISTHKNRYRRLRLSGHGILRLAENSPEWRSALKRLAQRHNLQPKTPMLRRLLELAENPPQPETKFSARCELHAVPEQLSSARVDHV
ncbi:MAG: hypothetical protein LM590_15015 [Thermofilum sp.]|nr:hypothetical protein [Thermofilum sp.]